MEPDDPNYPLVGFGLNHPAKLTFYNVHHADCISAERFEAFLRDQTKEKGAQFVSYDPASGTWVIRVPHFTRYGLESWELVKETNREPIDESRAKIPHVAEPASKSENETDQEEVKRILQEIRGTPLPFPENSRGFSAILSSNTLIYSNFVHIKSQSLAPSFSSFLLQPLRTVLNACASQSDSESSSSVPQLCYPMGKELVPFLARLQTSFESVTSPSQSMQTTADVAMKPEIPEFSSVSETAEVVLSPVNEANSIEIESNPMETESKSIEIEPNSIQNESNSINNESNIMQNEQNSIQNEQNSINTESNPINTESIPINTESNPIQKEPNSIHSSSLYYSLFWELFSLLFNPFFDSSLDYPFPSDPSSLSPHALHALHHRHSLFNHWLERLLRSPLFSSPTSLFHSHDAFATASLHLLQHDVWSACEALRADHFDRLAVQVAQISPSLRPLSNL